MRRLVSIVLALFLGSLALSEARGLPRYPFVHLEENHLRFPGGPSPEYREFYLKLDTLVHSGRGDVRILHVGGSHVQAGTWSERLRRRFLSLRYGMDGGRGLVFPFSAAGTNTPTGYNSSYTGNWTPSKCLHPDTRTGLTGMTVTAADTSARVVIDLMPRDNRPHQVRYSFNRVDVMGYGDMEPVLLLHGKDTIRGIGARGFWHFDLPCYTDWFQMAFYRPGGSFTLKGLYLDRSDGGLTFNEAGVNGAATSSWLRCDDWEQDLRRVMPDLVIFSIGINDIQGTDFDAARFKENYRSLIRKVRRVNPRCAILFTTNNDSWKRRDINPFTGDIVQAFRELAQEYHAAYWDLYAIMGGYGSMATWQEAGLAQSDKIHFTSEGYKLLGDLLFEAIMERPR